MSHSDNRISVFEGVSLMSLSLIFFVCDDTLPRLCKSAGNAGWLAQIVGVALVYAVFFLFVLLMRRYEGKNLMEICEEVFGKLLSKLILAGLCALFFLTTAMSLQQIVAVLNAYSYPLAKTFYMCLSFAFVAAVTARYPFKGLARVASICMPLVFFALLAVLVVSYRQYHTEYLTPVLGFGINPAIESGVKLFSNYNLFLGIMLFAGFFGGAGNFRKTGGISIGIYAATSIALTLCYNMAMPYRTGIYGTSGILQIAQNTYINRFFQRLESIFLLLFCMGVIVILCIGIFAIKTVYARIFGFTPAQTGKAVIPIAILIACAAQLLIYYNQAADRIRSAVASHSFYVVAGFVLLALIISIIRNRGSAKTLRVASMLLLPCILAGMFSGCQPFREPDEEVSAIILGYDKGENENYKISIKFMNEAQQAGGGPQTKPANDTTPEDLFVVEAPCNISVVDLLNTVIVKHVSLLHVKVLVISEELAREGVDKIIKPIMDHNETKSNMELVVCKDSAEAYIGARGVMLYTSLPMKAEMLMNRKRGTSAFDVVTVSEFFNNYSSGYSGATALYSAIRKNGEISPDKKLSSSPESSGSKENSSGQEPPKGQESEAGKNSKENSASSTDAKQLNPTGGTFEEGYLPGDVPVNGVYGLQTAGMAVFREDKMVGVLDTRETASYTMLNGEFFNAAYLVKGYRDSVSSITFIANSLSSPTIKTSIDADGTARIHISNSMRLQVAMSQDTGIDYESPDEKERLGNYVRRKIIEDMYELIEKAQKELDSDILRLGQHVSGNFLTIQEWEAYNWLEKYKDAVITVDCKVML